MNLSERALVFECKGEALVGVLAEPAVSSDIGVLIIVGGWQYRLGSHRQFLLLARHLAARGVPVLRFDYRGMGDSSGDVRTFEEIDDDIAAALDAFVSACPAVRKVVLWGLCDGASASLLYWNNTADPRIAGMVLLNPWVLSDEALVQSQIRHHYRQRVLQREFWAKLARGRVDVTGTLRTFTRALTGGIRSLRAGRTDGLAYQDRMAAALGAFPGPVLLILSGRDPAAKGFLDYCGTHALWRGLISRSTIERHSVPESDHTFSSVAWRQDVEAVTFRWLDRFLLRSTVRPFL